MLIIAWIGGSQEKMEKEEELMICKKAVNTFGGAIQQVIAMEEAAELIIAITDFAAGKENNLSEEIADVEIMCTQLGIIYNADKVKEYDRKEISIKSSEILMFAQKNLAMLIQGISKVIRDKNKHPEEYISNAKTCCRYLRMLVDEKEVDNFKDYKLNRLKGVVW